MKYYLVVDNGGFLITHDLSEHRDKPHRQLTDEEADILLRMEEAHKAENNITTDQNSPGWVDMIHDGIVKVTDEAIDLGIDFLTYMIDH